MSRCGFVSASMQCHGTPGHQGPHRLSMLGVKPRGTPRLSPTCRTCHAPATFQEQARKPAARIPLTGGIQRFAQTESVFYCNSHGGGN